MRTNAARGVLTALALLVVACGGPAASSPIASQATAPPTAARSASASGAPAPSARPTASDDLARLLENGVFVTAVLPPHEALAGARVTAIGGTPIGEVPAAVEPLVPRDGPATVPSFRPTLLLRTEVRG